MSKKYLTFFHHSIDYIEVFSSQSGARPAFYWFGDRYFNLFGKDHRAEYFYLFIKNPKKDDIAFRSRSEEMGFDGLYRHYLEYRKHWIEPAILMSFSKIIPDLALEYDQKEKAHMVIAPLEHRGTKINLHDERGRPKNFLDIPEILEIIPNIKNSHPFIDAKVIDGKYNYDNWIPMLTEKNGTWL